MLTREEFDELMEPGCRLRFAVDPSKGGVFDAVDAVGGAVEENIIIGPDDPIDDKYIVLKFVDLDGPHDERMEDDIEILVSRWIERGDAYEAYTDFLAADHGRDDLDIEGLFI